MNIRPSNPAPYGATADLCACRAVPTWGVGLDGQKWGADSAHEQTAAALANGAIARMLMANHKARKGPVKK